MRVGWRWIAQEQMGVGKQVVDGGGAHDDPCILLGRGLGGDGGFGRSLGHKISQFGFVVENKHGALVASLLGGQLVSLMGQGRIGKSRIGQRVEFGVQAAQGINGKHRQDDHRDDQRSKTDGKLVGDFDMVKPVGCPSVSR
jgi:hypothetical protein